MMQSQYKRSSSLLLDLTGSFSVVLPSFFPGVMGEMDSHGCLAYGDGIPARNWTDRGPCISEGAITAYIVDSTFKAFQSIMEMG